MAVMTSARRAARSARPTQLAKLLDLRHCKFLLNCLQQRLPLGERQAYVAGFGVRNISVQARQFDPTQCRWIAIIELKNDGASHNASCSQDLRDKDNSLHARVPASLTASFNRCDRSYPQPWDIECVENVARGLVEDALGRSGSR
jgi:hypothetical protein